jgi:hypothetical protein
VEITAYAILSLVKLGGEQNLISALQAVRWISKHRNAQGGFVSTQVVILKHLLLFPFAPFYCQFTMFHMEVSISALRILKSLVPTPLNMSVVVFCLVTTYGLVSTNQQFFSAEDGGSMFLQT